MYKSQIPKIGPYDWFCGPGHALIIFEGHYLKGSDSEWLWLVIFLCWSPHCQGFILPQQDQQRIWHTQSLQNIQLSPLSSSTTSLTADDFATFFTNKTRSIRSQFSDSHTQELKPTTSTDKTPLFSFCPLTVSKLLLSSHPTTCPLDPIPSHLLQAISHTSSTWTFNWDGATLSNWSHANHKSWFQIISSHSVGSICCFWHSQSSDPPVHPLITGHHWDPTSLVWILSQ